MRKAFERRYTRDQTDAVTFALVDRDLGTAHVVRLAAAGELTGPTGDRLDPFELNYGTAAGWKSTEVKKRKGLIRTRLTEMPARDATEILRKRLVATVDNRTTVMLDRQSKDRERKVDWEEVRQCARALREIGMIPEPKHATSAPGPSEKRDGRAGPSQGSLIQAMMREAKNGEGPTEAGPSGASAS